MNRNMSEGTWREFKGKLREQWGNLSDDELEKSKGNLEQIIGKIQAKYGSSEEETKSTLNDIMKKLKKTVH